MGAQAIQRILQEGAPERIERHHFRPESPDEIEPYIGSVRDRVGYPPAEFFGHYPAHFWYETMYNQGPSVNTLWLGKTAVGEAGRIKSGLMNNGTYAECSAGIASRMTIYDGFLHRQAKDTSAGIFRADYAELAGTENPTLKKLLAEMVFEMLNPSLTANTTKYIEIVLAGARKHAQTMRDLKAMPYRSSRWSFRSR